MKRRIVILILAALAGGPNNAHATADLAAVDGIGAYTIIEKSPVLAPNLSEFLTGYLGNVKNYTTYNLDQHYVHSIEEAQKKAAALGAHALLVAKVKGFASHQNSGKAKLHLLDIASGQNPAQMVGNTASALFRPAHVPPHRTLRQPRPGLCQTPRQNLPGPN